MTEQGQEPLLFSINRGPVVKPKPVPPSMFAMALKVAVGTVVLMLFGVMGILVGLMLKGMHLKFKMPQMPFHF